MNRFLVAVFLLFCCGGVQAQQVISNYAQIARLPGYFDRFQTYDVRDYGADGTDTTDDLAAIQAAIDAAHDVGGGVVYLPAGTYTLSGSLYLENNMAFLGQEEQTFIEPANSTVVPVIYATGTDEDMKHDVYVANIIFKKSNSTWRNAAGQLFLSHLTNVTIKNIKRLGTSLDSGQSCVSIRRCNNFSIDNIASLNTFVDSDTLTFSGSWITNDNAALVIGNVSVQHICPSNQTPAQVAAAVCALADASTHPNFTQYNWSVSGATITVTAVTPGTPINIAQSVGSGQGDLNGTQNYQGCIYCLQIWDGAINRVHAEWTAEIIDFTGCYKCNVSNITGRDCNQEGIDFGNCSDMSVSNVAVERARRILQMKTETSSNFPPGYVDPGGCNNNTFTNVRGSYIEAGVKNTANTVTPIQSMSNNKFIGLDLRSVGASSTHGFYMSKNNDNTPGQNCILDDFRIVEENGYGIYIVQDVENFTISNGYIESALAAVQHDYPATILVRDRGTVSNVRARITGASTLYGMWFGPRRDLTLRDVEIIGGGLYLIDQINLTIDNLQIEEAKERGFYLQWKGQDTTTWPTQDNYVNADLRNIRLKNTNKTGQTFGFVVTATDATTTIRGIVVDGLTIIDDQATATTCGFRFSGTFVDCSLLNSYVPLTTSPLALADPRDSIIAGTSNIHQNNRGWLLSENRGQVSIANTSTAADMVTGINSVAAEDITITPLNATAAALNYSISYVSGTTCRITVTAAPGSGNTATWAWVAERVN